MRPTGSSAPRLYTKRLAIDVRFLSAQDVERLRPTIGEVLEVVETVVLAQGEGEVVLEPRVHLEPGPHFHGHWNVLRAFVAPLGVAGVKVVGDFVDNFRRDLPSELGLLTLYDPETGAPRAIIDATLLTSMRTGALTAVGAKHLARPDSRVLAHLGARGTAFWNVTMLASLYELDEIRVTSARAESRERFGRELERALRRPVRVIDTVRDAIEGADIVYTDVWVSMGDERRCAQELRDATQRVLQTLLPLIKRKRNRSFLEDAQEAMKKWNELMEERGLLTRESLYAELGEIVAGRKPGRERPEERILFWHRGLATCDVALGAHLLQRATAEGAGTVLRYRP